MNIKLNQNQAISTATQGVGSVAGALASKGAMSFVGEGMKTPLYKGVLGAALLVGASAISGSGVVCDASRGFLFGAGLQQTLEAVAKIISPNVVADENAQGMQKFLGAAVNGLAGNQAYASRYEPINISASAWEDAEQEKETIISVV